MPRAFAKNGSLRLTWAPWQHGGDDPVALGRPYLLTSADVDQVFLSPPPCELPLVWRSDDVCCFELPLPVARSDDPTVQAVDLRLRFSSGEERGEHLVLRGGIPRPKQKPSEPDEDAVQHAPDPIEKLGLDAEAFIAGYVESVNEIIYPSRAAGRRPARAEGLSLAPWRDCDEILWSFDREEAPLRLIVRVAEDCAATLESVCARPRRVLRRERRLERLDRVQQIDDTCLRWFVRQPGRTILEKAGPRQRVLSVIRTETADTHENRVVRDFLERCLRAADLYLLENRARAESYRIVLVRRFRNRLHLWMKHSQLAEVPRLTGTPGANYVLQFDQRYRRIWYWYERIRRQQTYQDEVWRWQHRAWGEHSSLAVMHILGELQGSSQGFAGRLFLRTDPRCGQFIDDRSPVGSWVIGHSRPLLVETISGIQAMRASADLPELRDLSRLGPDFVVAARSSFHRGTNFRILAFWTSLRSPGSGLHLALEAWLRGLAKSVPTSFARDGITPVLLIPASSTAPSTPVEERLTDPVSGLTAIGLRIPVPVSEHLPWLTSFVRTWLKEEQR